jgi:hypothetical protein
MMYVEGIPYNDDDPSLHTAMMEWFFNRYILGVKTDSVFDLEVPQWALDLEKSYKDHGLIPSSPLEKK